MPGKCRCVARWNGDHCETYDESFPGGVTYPSTDDQCDLNQCQLKAADGQCDVSRDLNRIKSNLFIHHIYTIILHKSVCLSVCRRSQTAGHNSCSIVSGDVSN